MSELAVWQRTIVDEEGNIVPLAEVEVRHEHDDSLATIYADRDGETELNNPLTADTAGFVRFYTEGGAYKVTATGAGSEISWRFVAVGTLAERDRALFESASEVENSRINPGITAIRTNGYYAPGDGGGALYVEGGEGPGAIQSGDGRWWELADQPLNVRMFGAVADGVTDDTSAIKEAVLYTNDQASQIGRATLEIPEGDYLISPGSTSAESTGWRVIFPLHDNVTVRGKGRFVYEIPNATRSLIFGVRGDNVIADGLRFLNTRTESIPWTIGIGWGDTYDGSLDARVYRNLTVRNCEFHRQWLPVSCQSRSDTVSELDGVRLENNFATMDAVQSSGGGYNFRSNTQGKIRNVVEIGNVMEHGPNSACFNHYGVWGVLGIGNTQLGADVYAGVEFEKGTRDVIWDGFRSDVSEGRRRSIWIDQSSNISMSGFYCRGRILITAERTQVADVKIGSGVASRIQVPNFGTYEDGIIKDVHFDGTYLTGSDGDSAVFIQGSRVQSIYLKNVNVSPSSTSANKLTVVRGAEMGLVHVEGGNLDDPHFNYSGTGGKVVCGSQLKPAGTDRVSIDAGTTKTLTFAVPPPGQFSVIGGKILFIARDMTNGPGATWEALFRIHRSGSDTLSAAISTTPSAGVGTGNILDFIKMGATATIDGGLTVSIENQTSAVDWTVRGFCEVTPGSTVS